VRELIDLSTLCLEHCKGNQFYCLTCSQEVCQDCTTVGLHAQHRHQLREELLDEQRHHLSSLVTATESNLLAATTLTKQWKGVTAEKAAAKRAINQAFERLHVELQARRQELLRELAEGAEEQVEGGGGVLANVLAC
jgi:hypothetical protein